MIIVTVGMQLGFDRLIETMDELAPSLGAPVIAQIGKGSFKPVNMEHRISIAPDEFETLVSASCLIVSHAGIGTVLTAKRHAKPIVLFPRRASLGEHRNDHQMATARQLQGQPGIFTAFDNGDIRQAIAMGLSSEKLALASNVPACGLEAAVVQFIETGKL